MSTKPDKPKEPTRTKSKKTVSSETPFSFMIRFAKDWEEMTFVNCDDEKPLVSSDGHFVAFRKGGMKTAYPLRNIRSIVRYK
jgi:hypothetical protein